MVQYGEFYTKTVCLVIAGRGDLPGFMEEILIDQSNTFSIHFHRFFDGIGKILVPWIAVYLIYLIYGDGFRE
jgi:hypothetical protein